MQPQVTTLYFGFLYLGGKMDWSLHQWLMVAMLSGVILRIDILFTERKWKSRWKWVIFLILMFLSGYSDQRGWPSRTDDIDNFTYISGVVQQPTENVKGKIFIWVYRNTGPKLPFAIELDYDEELAKRVNIANFQSILNGEMSVDMRQFKEINEPKKKNGYISI